MATFHRVLASPKRVQGTVGIVNFINQPEHFLSVNRHVRSLYILPKKQLSTTSSCLKTWSKKLNRDAEIDNTEILVAGKNKKRAERLYVWGYAATGALGVNAYIIIIKLIYIKHVSFKVKSYLR